MTTTKIGNACKAALAVAITGSLFAGTAQAKLAGHNVILVHGFQQEDLANPPENFQAVKDAGEDYWRTFWLSRSDARVDWGSDGRIEGSIAQQAYQQIRQISQQGLCSNYCIVVSHSTGDLVTRYLLENQARWLQSEGLAPLKILAAIDYSGAGGGTELADLALSIAYNDSWYNWPLKAAVEAFTGIEPEPGKLGVVNDLQTNAARNLAISPNSIPRLRFVAGGASYGGVTKPFIAGTDDGVVPTHSACGSTTAEGIDSCSNRISLAGKVTSQNGPDGLWFNHFPVLMNEGVTHSGVLGSETGYTSVPVVNNTTLNGLRVDFASRTYNQRAWWQWWGAGDTYIEVPGSDQTDMSTLVYTTLNN
ncbi:hypothetical protein QQF73_08385 [Marinobacter sp. M216]|uniref:Alpha/beta hydrolase n=1 Tax=Marinobacter albus TaxID=3030833 RepID=A0ABT7HC92_9GAMM|nr:MULTISPECIES: hypothetical protein [unclassified Marinobacter]MBW7470099.1 hypothetical protein [Marinobacter sp. F4218]MDK9557637.1 hypothetical protein [Marinobacter sp. M216]